MSLKTIKKSQINKKIFLLIFFLAFTIFVFSSDAHRHSGDENWQNLQAIRMVTLEPHSLYVDGESKTRFEYPVDYPLYWQGTTCFNYILCSPASIGASVTQVPFIFINHNFHVITEDTVTWTLNDFNDSHYVFWRNSIDPDFTFLELFYGPVFSALSVSVFFLISRSFNYEMRTSLILTLLFGLATPIWAYSQTTLSLVPMVFILLLGFYFFRKFQKNDSAINLIFCAICLGFGFMVRQEMAMIIIVLMAFFIYNLRKKEGKIKKIFCYIAPQIIFYACWKSLEYISTGSFGNFTDASALAFVAHESMTAGKFLTRQFGLLFSPGVGLFFFVPILFTVFFAFPDFVKKHKPETFFILGIIAFFMVQMGSFGHWHGLVSWGGRYLIPCIPFLLLPLGASIEHRKGKKLMLIIIILGSLGFLFNLVYLAQDVSWFTWGQADGELGLFSLGSSLTGLYIHDSTIWTFEYSQLTNSVISFFTDFFPDIFLLKLMGSGIFVAAIFSLLLGQAYVLYRILNNSEKTKSQMNVETL